ncbi:MAG: hypothetical protein WCA00_21515 [Candidatus Acidiferrales bacterium]
MHRDFTHSAQWQIRKKFAAKPRHAYQCKARREKSSQGAKCRERQELIAQGVAEDDGWISETLTHKIRLALMHQRIGGSQEGFMRQFADFSERSAALAGLQGRKVSPSRPR